MTRFAITDGTPSSGCCAARRYVLGDTPTSSVNRVLKVPSEESEVRSARHLRVHYVQQRRFSHRCALLGLFEFR